MRSRQSLRGKDSLAEDLAAQLGVHRILHHQIDACSEDLFEPALYPEELKQTDRAIELDQEVHVAVGPASSRTTEPNRRSERTPSRAISAR